MTPKHDLSIGAAEAEGSVWRALCDLLSDPWRVENIWRSLYVGQQNSPPTDLYTGSNLHAGAEPELGLRSRPASVEIPLYDFTQRIRQATAATDFQTRWDLMHFLIDQIVVSDDAVRVMYVIPLHEYGWLARTLDDLVAVAKFKIVELNWSFDRLRLAKMVEDLGGVNQLFGQWFALVYLGWLTLAGLMIAVGYVQAGLVLDGGLVVFLLYLVGYMPPSDEARLAWASALPPVLRLLSYSVPIPNASLVVQLGLVGVVALLATLVMMYALQRPLSVYGVRLRNVRVQIAIAPLGLLIGGIQWLLFEPQLASMYADLVGVERIAFLSLFITGVTEELVFRGILQQGAYAVFRGTGYYGSGLLYTNITFAVMHIGFGPIALIFAFMVGLLYGVLTSRTGSIFGVLWAHGLSSMVLLALMAR